MEKPHQINKFYDKATKKYFKFSEDSFSWKYIEKPAIAKNLTDKINGEVNILDIGCGSGRIIKLLLSLGAKQKNITGIDPSIKMIDIARDRFPKVNFIHEDIALTKNLTKNYYDFAIGCLVMHYLDDNSFKRAMKNIYSSLRNGGAVCLVLPHPNRIKKNNKGIKYGWNNEKTPWGLSIPFYFRSNQKYINLLRNIGFRNIKFSSLKSKSQSSAIPKEYSKYPSRILIKAGK